MKVSIIPSKTGFPKLPKESSIDHFVRQFLLEKLANIQYGQITVADSGRFYTFGQSTKAFSLKTTINVHHPRFYARIVLGGSIGAAEAYMDGMWSTGDLTTVIRILIRNQSVFEEMEKGWARLSEPVHRIYHALRRNTLQGSKSNIIAHYDLGNDFYALFLDETMTYSCGIFEKDQCSMEEASTAKYRRICQKLQLTSKDHVLEIGTGWGGFAIFAAGHYGCRVTTTTISPEQYKLASQRIHQEDLTDKITLLCRDYRKMEGCYDKLVSIEMIEAVGHQYLDTFFAACSRLLREDGMMMLQAITIRDQLYEQHRRSVDFIKRYIFPGGCLPSVAAMAGSIAGNTDLTIFHLEDITPHYVKTLREWRKRFFINIDKVRVMGFPESFIRMWEYYLCYCEAGFAERYIGNVQMLLTKPLCRREPLLPAL
ncbi:MAG: cyclopropane-fatty-acyl-phospholipid synthase family protein [Desulfobacterales bacterium]